MTHITAGYVRRRDGQHSGWRISAEALRPAVSMWDRLAVFIDHANLANLFYPSMKDLAAVTFAPSWNTDQQSIDGGIRLYNRSDLVWLRMFLDEVLEDQEQGREVPDVGLSAVLYAQHEQRPVEPNLPDGETERVTVEIKKVESSDLVFGPGAEGRLREALALFNRSLFSIAEGGVVVEEQDVGIGSLESESRGEEGQRGGDGAAVDGQEAVMSGPPEPPKGGSLQHGQNGEVAGFRPLPGGGRRQQVHPLVAEFVQTGQSNVESQFALTVANLSQQLDGLQRDVARLGQSLAKDEDEHLVEGMGVPPRDKGKGNIWGMRTGLDELSGAVDWLFGVKEAPLPEPLMRNPANLYQMFTGDWEWHGKFHLDRVMLSGATTATLPGLAVNAMNKVLFSTWASLRHYRWYEYVVTVVPNDGSTHEMQWLGFGGTGELPEVPEKGAYTELTPADTKESDGFVKYGGYVGLTLEMFRRGEVAKIQALAVALARDSVMTRSKKLASIFTSNSGVGPTLAQDGKALFHADHGNVDTTAFGTDSTAWNAVDLAIWNQAEIGSGNPLGISPKYWLGNRAGYRQALVTFGYGDGQPTTYVPEALDRGPDDPRPFPLAVPHFSDTNDWAAIVDPLVYPVIGMSYAQATSGGTHPMPELWDVTDPKAGLVFSNDTMPIKVRDWFAFGVNGWRGIAKRNVT